MVSLTMNSLTSLKIVMAFIRFLNIVQGSSPTEQECLQTIKVCLKTIFRIQDSHQQDAPTGSVMDTMNFGENIRDGVQMEPNSAGASSSAPHNIVASSSNPGGFWSVCCTWSELYRLFNLMLPENINFLNLKEYPAMRKAAFVDAVEELTASGKEFNPFNLVEAIIMLGQKAMSSMDYHGAAILYTYAIAMWEDNAAFYCHRAYALLNMKSYQEAMADCMTASLINPRSVDVFNAVGSIYLHQEKYLDAICKGFSQALQIDPLNEIAQQNMELSARKLKAIVDAYDLLIFDFLILLTFLVENMDDEGRGRRQQNRGRGQRRQPNARRTRVRANNHALLQAPEVIDIIPQDYEQNFLNNGGAAALADMNAAPVNVGAAPDGAGNDGREEDDGYAAS